MTKKDRIAIVATAFYLLLPLKHLMDGRESEFLILLIFILAYWSYRFIKNDISFLGSHKDGE